MRLNFILPVLLTLTLGLNAQSLSTEVQRALKAIGPAELKGDLSFLASDALQGRFTPSPGLDVAAEFIASRFRAIGLHPADGLDDYFQNAAMVQRKMPRVITPLISHEGTLPITVEPAKIQVISASSAAHVVNSPVLKINERTPEKLAGLDLDGKVVLVAALDVSTLPAENRASVRQRARAFDKAVKQSKALLEIVVVKALHPASASHLLFAEDLHAGEPPVINVESPELAASISSLADLAVSVDIPAPQDESATVKNVIGVIPGSDPRLKSTCVLVTAHYDHIGTTDTASGLSLSEAAGSDKIFNGANDDGSGTVSVIEIARGLSLLHPKRSIAFIAFFGEELGLLGSTYYGRHPLFPLAKTVADVNLEQVGRTDSSEGPQIANASVTGYDYSEVTKYLEDAGKLTGIKIYKDEAGSDDYFLRSDNEALAQQGIPAHTLTTAFEYPDYHAVGDEWQKIDYFNMAKVDRTVALAVFNIANARKAPAWNDESIKTKAFIEARKKVLETSPSSDR